MTRPGSIVALLAVLGALAIGGAIAIADSPGDCGVIDDGSCGVQTDQGAGRFHGLIAVTGEPWVLDTAAGSGTQAGCGDCRWSIVLACPDESLDDPSTLTACALALDSPACGPRQLLYRLYLSTRAVTDAVEGNICLGGAHRVVPVGDTALADVAKYLKNVRPPEQRVDTRPRRAGLAGLPTRFAARPARVLRPQRFGGPTVTETITITPRRICWHYGDGGSSGWLSSRRIVRHTYRHGRVMHGWLATRWTATYTVTYGGRTFGPFPGRGGGLSMTQPFRYPVRTTTPVLVSR
jgi:hypothetical protein